MTSASAGSSGRVRSSGVDIRRLIQRELARQRSSWCLPSAGRARVWTADAARRYRTIQLQAGAHTITAADPLPDDLRSALASIHGRVEGVR